MRYIQQQEQRQKVGLGENGKIKWKTIGAEPGQAYPKLGLM